jgi:hypothetical protein
MTCGYLVCNTVSFGENPMYQISVLPPPSVLKSNTVKEMSSFDTEDGGCVFP